ncbi:MAG: winged helix-turn-helix domain-containing protein, partial [Candidatus Thiodiazotropha sp.]
MQGESVPDTDRTVDTHVKNLRKKLNAVTPDEEIIRSIYG